MQWIRRGGHFQVIYLLLPSHLTVLYTDFLLDTFTVLSIFHSSYSARRKLLGMFNAGSMHGTLQLTFFRNGSWAHYPFSYWKKPIQF